MNSIKPNPAIVLTGDRPTGQLHLGHYVGSLKNRLKLQDQYQTFLMIADAQALTDNAENPEKVRKNVFEVALDYLAVGIDPQKVTIFIQSAIPELAELTLYYANLVSFARLQRNPTVKEEIKQKNYGESTPTGFIIYPISQAADITAFKASIVPVGNDQMPMIEQTNEIVRTFNRIYGKEVLVEAEAYLSQTPRLQGTDGKAKMSKSLGNFISLAETETSISQKVKKMFTDPGHLKIEDPGKIEGNTVFAYLDAFDPDTEKVTALKEHYQKGGLADSIVKKRLEEVLLDLLNPIRARREKWEKMPDAVWEIIKKGCEKARETSSKTLSEVKSAMLIDYFK